MAERTNATVLKTVEGQPSGGSNPPPSAHFDVRPRRAPCSTPGGSLAPGVYASSVAGEVPESGRSGLPAKEVRAQALRGFKSHPLRQLHGRHEPRPPRFRGSACPWDDGPIDPGQAGRPTSMLRSPFAGGVVGAAGLPAALGVLGGEGGRRSAHLWLTRSKRHRRREPSPTLPLRSTGARSSIG